MTDVLDEIARELKDNKVVVYMKGTPSFPMCGFSAATVQVLREVGVPFKAIDVLAEPEKREAIKRFSNWPTIPQVYVGGKFIGGCDIVREMHARGERAAPLRREVTTMSRRRRRAHAQRAMVRASLSVLTPRRCRTTMAPGGTPSSRSAVAVSSSLSGKCAPLARSAAWPRGRRSRVTTTRGARPAR